jgi:hypothetical protein
MNYNKIKKIVNVFSDGSFLIIKSSFFDKLNFLEKDDRNSILWLKLNETKNSIDKFNFRKKFLNRKNKFLIK